MTLPRWHTTTMLRAFCFSFNPLLNQDAEIWVMFLARSHFQNSANAHRMWCSTCTRWTRTCTKQERAALCTSRVTNSSLLRAVWSMPSSSLCWNHTQQAGTGTQRLGQASKSGHWQHQHQQLQRKAQEMCQQEHPSPSTSPLLSPSSQPSLAQHPAQDACTVGVLSHFLIVALSFF